MVTPDDIRPKWWTILVALVDIILPTIMVTGFFIAPETMFLDHYIEDDPYLSKMFRLMARSNACGDSLGILICIVLITTKELISFRLCNIFMTFWLGLENSVSFISMIKNKGSLDPLGDAIDAFCFLLQIYMFFKIRANVRSNPMAESVPLV